MNEVEGYIYQQGDLEREVMLYLHQLLVDENQLTPKIKYRVPFYYRKSWICYLNPLKKGGVELNFTRGNELENTQHLLNFRGRTQVGGIVLNELNDLPHDLILTVLNEALALDESKPYASKRKSK
jgi:hypothetical protein